MPLQCFICNHVRFRLMVMLIKPPAKTAPFSILLQVLHAKRRAGSGFTPGIRNVQKLRNFGEIDSKASAGMSLHVLSMTF